MLWHPRPALFDEVYTIENLTRAGRAWRAVRTAHGSAGLDRVSIAAFEAG